MHRTSAKRKSTTFITAGLAAALLAATTLTAVSAAPALQGAFGREAAFAPPSATELGLAGTRAQQWDALRSETIALRRVAREEFGGGMIELRALLDRPNPDLRAFSDASQRKFDAHVAEMRALRERQLDLYESLSPAEQAKVRAAMAQRLDRFAQMRERIVAFVEARR